MTWTPLQKLSISSGAVLLLVGLAGVIAYFYANREVVADQAVAQTNSNMRTAYRLIARTATAERLTKAYVVRPDSATRRSLERVQSDVEDALDELRRSTEDNPRQRRMLDDATPFVGESFREFRNTVALRDRFGPDSARRYLMRETSPHAADSLLAIIGNMRDEELRVLAERTRLQVQTGARAMTLIELGTILAFLLAAVALQPMRASVAARLSSHLTPAAEDTPQEWRLRALQNLIHALAPIHDPAVGARQLVAIGAAPFEAALSAVVVPDAAGEFTVLMSSDGAFDAVPPELEGPIADTLRTAAFVHAESRTIREQSFGPVATLDACGATGAVLFVPLWSDAVAKGVLLLAFGEDRDMSEDELDFAATLGRLGGPAVTSRALTT